MAFSCRLSPAILLKETAGLKVTYIFHLENDNQGGQKCDPDKTDTDPELCVQDICVSCPVKALSGFLHEQMIDLFVNAGCEVDHLQLSHNRVI